MMAKIQSDKIPGPSLLAVAATFSPFAVLLSVALLFAEAETRIVLHRAMYTVWLSSIFATAAYVLYILNWDVKPRYGRVYQYWRLLWTFAALGYLVHFYYTFIVLYRMNVHAVFDQQTRTIALSNFIFTGWWVLDVALAWLTSAAPSWRRLQGICFQGFSFVVFIVAFVFLRPGVPQVLGAGMILSVLIALLFRVFRLPVAIIHPVP